STAYYNLSAVESGFWPIVLVACRHYRYPVPLHILFPQPQDETETTGPEADVVQTEDAKT
ncbi:MAG: hypothetical protein AAF639_42650, partial [Chloroflexota bacterium]